MFGSNRNGRAGLNCGSRNGLRRNGSLRFSCFHSLSNNEKIQLLNDDLNEIERERQNIIEEITRLKK